MKHLTMKYLTLLMLVVLSPLLNATSPSIDLQLTENEKNWLEKNPVIQFTGDPNWLPFEAFNKDQVYIGIVSEHLHVIEERLGIKFNIIPTKNWTESVNMAKTGRVDVLSETDDSALKSHLLFSQSYLETPVVIVMRNTENYIESLDKIKHKKIAVIRNYGYVTKIVNKYDYIDFYIVEDIQDGLMAVSTGRADALLCTVTLCGYTISEMSIHNIKIIGKTEFDTKLAFGVSKQLPELVSILNKAIQSITAVEQQDILDNWHMQQYVEKVDYTLAWKILVPILTVLIIFVISWNRRLSNEIILRKAIESDLKEATKKSEDAVNSKSDFLAKMSHEIRTPMNGVLGMAELLESSDLDDTQKHYLRVIQRSGNTLMVVINDILDYSKIEAGKTYLQNSPLELNDLIEETTVPYRLIPDSNVQFDVHLDTNIPVHLIGDAVRLHQVLSNLLNNAFKFTHAGSIILSASLVKLNNTDAEIKFSVSDSGEGIDESTLKIIFDPFTQADQSTARKHGGTGLGLSICKRLIELMGGELTVDSTLGKGSVFYFCVRLSLNESPITISDKKTNPEDHSNLRVLLVEDNLVNQMVLKGYLEKLGIQSCVVSDGEAATDIICEHRRPFDLILMDCEMPGIDGYQATKKIRQWELATNQPAITICALTAHVLPEHISKCKESGMDNHLTKPLKLNDLTEYLRTLDSFKI